MVDSPVYHRDDRSIRYGYIIAAYNKVIYQLKRSLRGNASEQHQQRFQKRKAVLENEITERDIFTHLSPHLRRCFGVVDISTVKLPGFYKSREDVRRQIEAEENNSLFCRDCNDPQCGCDAAGEHRSEA